MRLRGGVAGGGDDIFPPSRPCYDEAGYFFEVIGTGNMLEFIPLLDPIGNITEVQWDFGDGSAIVTSGPMTTVIHTFPYDGNFTVNLAIHTDNGCNTHISRNVVSNCTPGGEIRVGAVTETRNSTNTEPPASALPEALVTTISMCDIPDVLSGEVRMGWLTLLVDCCATLPIYIEPRTAGNQPFNTCVRTGAEEFTYTISASGETCTGGGGPRVFKIESPAFNVLYAGPYTMLNIPIMFTWVSGPKGGFGCNNDIVFRMFGCSVVDNALLGYFRLTSAGAPCP